MSDTEQGARANEPAEAGLYRQLAEPFERTHFRDGGGGIKLEYIDGEQCVSRLNETLGFLNWSFTILEHGIHAEADECWVLGELTVVIGDRLVKRQQFGSQKVHRDRSSGIPRDLGFDLKGAGTDALKKCATLVGVALYLYEKEAPTDRVVTPGNAEGSAGPRPIRSSPNGDVASLVCEQCGDALTETRFKDGTNWTAAQLAIYGRRKFKRALCMSHYREANVASRRQAEGAVPF